jgi:hypothetical protein
MRTTIEEGDDAAMEPAPYRNILEATFRANPDYELVLFDRLTQKERTALANLQQDPDLYGLLRPRGPGSSLKSACRETALLFFTLQTPGPLPGYVTTRLGPACNEAMARLVLDRILEIEEAGTFLSGAEAHRLIYAEQSPIGAGGVLGQLSLAAVRYAQGLDVAESTQLSTRMYCYNRIPASPAWKRRFPSAEALAEHLEIHRAGRHRPVLETQWRSLPPAPDNPGWHSWVAADRNGVGGSARSYKLYVSPRCEHLSEAFDATLEVLTAVRAPSFKIGRDLYGVLRPDKLVAYFGDFEAVREAGDRLRRRLEGMPAQGVPFTAALDEAGLLSWGMDPPRSEHLLAWQGPSWRRWITDRLAVALLSARAAPPGPLEPWQFALDRLRLENIDTTTWTPAATLWNETRKE